MRIIKATLLTAVLLQCMCLLFSCPVRGQETEKPNIIFLFADDLGWGDLSCYGSERIETPSLDKLASGGILFTQFYVAGSVCSPSRAGIMTGQYPARNGIYGHLSSHERNQSRGMPDYLDPDLFMLTDMLKEAGYTTGHFGKWHLGTIPPAQYGIDVYMSNEHSNVRGGEKLDIWSPGTRPTCTRDILDEAMHFIRENRERPFYINVWFSDIHATLNPSEEQLDKVSRYKPINDVDFYGVDQVYLATLLEMDKQIGIFLNELDSMGLSGHTLVMFSSDNGPEDYQIRNAAHSGVGSAGPFRGRKRSIYEGGIRVPFILRWPEQIPRNRINTTSVICGVDFIPTLASITGASVPPGILLDGEDMSDIWLGADRQRKQILHWEWRYRVFGHVLNRCPMIAVRDGDYKLLMNPDSSRIELYHIANDPSEMQDLSGVMPDLTDKLIKEALEWYETIPESPMDESAGRNDWRWPVLIN